MATGSRKLTSKELRFVEAYLGDAQGNGSKAAILAGYATPSARVTASKLLAKANIQAALANARDQMANQALVADQIVRAKVMTGDEAHERMSLYARGDIGAVLPDGDPLKNLPPAVRATIKSVRPTRWGRTIELYDAMHATETILRVSGQLTQKHEVKLTRTHEDILAEVNELERARALEQVAS